MCVHDSMVAVRMRTYNCAPQTELAHTRAAHQPEGGLWRVGLPRAPGSSDSACGLPSLAQGQGTWPSFPVGVKAAHLS